MTTTLQTPESLGKALRTAAADRSGPNSVALDAVQRLLATDGVRVNEPNRNGKCAVHFAAQLRCDTEVLKLLVEAKADVNAATHRGHTPLIYAAGRGRINVVEFLLDHGADAATWTVQGDNAISMGRKRGLPAELMARMEASLATSTNHREFKDDPRAQAAQEEHARNCSCCRRQMLQNGEVPPMEVEIAELAVTLGAAAAESIDALSAALLAAATEETSRRQLGDRQALRKALEFSLGAGAFAVDAADDDERVCLRAGRKQLRVAARSGRAIGLEDVPEVGGRCHFDRRYVFESLGAFASLPRTLYVRTSNDDRETAATDVMWSLESHVALNVFLNFRSEAHAKHAAGWLDAAGWRSRDDLQSTVTSGVPNGPYSGPIYCHAFAPTAEGGAVTAELMGSDTWEGTYLVFVQLAGGDHGDESFGCFVSEMKAATAKVEGAEEDEGEGESEEEGEEEGEDEEEGEEEEGEEEGAEYAEEEVGTAITCEQLLLASRDEALGRCLGKGAKGRARRPVRMVTGAVIATLQAPGVVDALRAKGVALSTLIDAADAHVAAELVTRWPAGGRDADVCAHLFRRLVRGQNGWASFGDGGAQKRAGGAKVQSWSRALRWAATAGFDGWEACATELLEEAEQSSTCLGHLLVALRQLQEKQRQVDGADEAAEAAAAATPWRRKKNTAIGKLEHLPPALHALLLARYGERYGRQASEQPPRGGGGSGEQQLVGAGYRHDLEDGWLGRGASGPEPQQLASLPMASLGFEPTWVERGDEVRALHAELRRTADEQHARGGRRLRIGVDTEWIDGEPTGGESSSSPPPRVAVVQLAVDGRAWVIDALGSCCAEALGELLRWMLGDDEKVTTLGFAFRGDLAVLEKLCAQPGAAAARLEPRSLVDLQQLCHTRGENTPSLRRVVARTLGLRLDKEQQCSDWARRPLEREQFVYAALDAEVLLRVHDALLAQQERRLADSAVEPQCVACE